MSKKFQMILTLACCFYPAVVLSQDSAEECERLKYKGVNPVFVKLGLEKQSTSYELCLRAVETKREHRKIDSTYFEGRDRDQLFREQIMQVSTGAKINDQIRYNNLTVATPADDRPAQPQKRSDKFETVRGYKSISD
jgi:hypothetical protein